MATTTRIERWTPRNLDEKADGKLGKKNKDTLKDTLKDNPKLPPPAPLTRNPPVRPYTYRAPAGQSPAPPTPRRRATDDPPDTLPFPRPSPRIH